MNRGRVEQVDAPDMLYSLPRTRFVADFIGTCNLLTGPVVRADGATIVIEVADLGTVVVAGDARPAAQSEGALALRPEKVRLAAPGTALPGENRFTGVVTGMLYHGDVTVYRVRTTRGHEIEALLANSASGLARFFETGDAVELAWPVDAGHFVER
jgi:spermidine/putrescine transport system ATP-binding protein